MILDPMAKPRPSRCEYRKHCMVEVTRDGVELLVPRSTWGVPCFYEAADSLMDCGQRVSWKTHGIWFLTNPAE